MTAREKIAALFPHSVDGRFQRLHIQPGEHELTLYLEGHRKVMQTILIRPRSSFRIRYEMTPLAAGEAPDARPSKPAKPPAPPDAPAAEGDPAGVDVRGNETSSINVSLSKGEGR